MGSLRPPGPLHLALETSGSLGSVAVGAGGRALARRFLDRPTAFAADLIPMVAAALTEAGVAAKELAGIVVGSGPGSFTGVRVAAATGKGLAHALGVPLWAFSSLEAAAVADRGDGFRYVVFDARDDRVYAALYRVGADRVEERIPPYATRVGVLELGDLPRDACFVGDGAIRHEAALRAAGHRVLARPAGMPTAEALLHLLALAPDRTPVDPGARWEPDYVRPSNAERVRAG